MRPNLLGIARAPRVAGRLVGAAAVALALVTTLASAAGAAERYLRHPDLHGDHVVFMAEDDLWIAPAGGGEASRLTSGVGTEYFPHFSPDGRWVAFTGQYDGNMDVYVVSADGGEPRRLTWHPTRDEVVGWMDGGKSVLFRSRREHPHGSWEMFKVAVGGGDPEKLPIGRCARLSIDPVSGRYAINRMSRETSTWKRYRGGTSPDIWVGLPNEGEFRRVTTFEGPDAIPMWREGRIWFVTDQGGTANLWSMFPDGSDRKRETTHDEWDVRWPSMSPDGRVVYMYEGGLRLFDPATGQDRDVPIDVKSESVLTRQRYPNNTARLEFLDLAPDGDRVAVTTRGEIFSVPVDKGVTLAISAGSGAREKYGTFDEKGENILYVTDAPREEEIRQIDAWGRGKPTTVTPAGKKGWHFPPVVSPDGSRIAWADETQTLWVQKRSGGSPVKVDRGEQEEIRDYVWSPDGRWIAYSKRDRTDFPSVYVYDTQENRTRRVTGVSTFDYSPTWDPEGRWLAFLSDRTINPLFGQRDFQNVEFKPTKPYLLLLTADGKSPFREDAGLPPKDGKDADKADKKKDKKKDKD
ncbi:MAG: PD40 domain-containing protein, partial [Gemmatimonadetes bacterium]|nr:PD40 domain-containing protein [Gemmatimonadota bacterium]